MSLLKLTILLAMVLLAHTQQQFDLTKCRTSIRGKEYIGTLAVTVNGKPCQYWDSDSIPTSYSKNKFPGSDRAASANYCRNPDNSGDGPWCFEEGGNTKVLCNVKYCHGHITSVEPRYIAEGGAVKITIHGKGFAASQFNFGDESHVGNVVKLTNDYESHDCEVFKDASTEEMIQCYTPARLSMEQWKVRGSVDGVDIPLSAICGGHPNSWTCSVQARDWMSPYIDKIIPRSGKADGLITITGKIFTDLYGSLESLSSNGKTQKILRVYVHGKPCELKDGDVFYGVQLDNSKSDYGYIKCKISSLGGPFNGNVSVIIEAPYGRTYIKPSAYHVSAAGKVFAYQSYAVVDSVSAHSGSVEGGHMITITGQNFDETTAPAEVKVGNDDCVVEELTETQIVCSTPPKPSGSADSYPGNRGMKHDYFNATMLSYADIDQLKDRDDEVTTFWTDGVYWCETAWNIPYECTILSGADNYMIRSIGYFIPQISGDYEFLLKVDDYATVYFGDDRILAREYSHAGYIFIGAKLYTPNLVQRISGKVEPETQIVTVSSEENQEEITLTRTDLTTQIAVSEVQEVTVTLPGGDGVWQLGINGVYTDLLDVDTDDLELEGALNDLPTLYPDTVTVTSSEITNGTKFVITFNSELGDWPQFDKKTSGGAIVIVNNITTGVTSHDQWRLQLRYNDVYLLSDMMFSKLPDAENMTEAVTSIFSARCPRSIGPDLGGLKHYDGMEEKSSPGKTDFASEPFCGRASTKNPGIVFKDLKFDMQYGGYMCFAYRGRMQKHLRLYVGPTGKSASNIYPQHYLPISDNESIWQYACLDLVKLAQTKFTSQTRLTLWSVQFYAEANKDLWLDELTVGMKATTQHFGAVVNDRRIMLPVRMEKVSVTHNETLGTYNVSLRPHGCIQNFQMMRIFLTPKLAGSTESSSSVVRFGDDAAEFEFMRTSAAAPPVTGTYQLSLGSTTKDIAADLLGSSFDKILNLDFGINDTKVRRRGSCYGYIYDIEFTTRTGGDVPILSVNGTNLVGNTPAVDVEVSNAHMFYDPIPGDMVSTAEPLPQVRVTLNNILSRCAGDCSYEYKDAETPTVTAVNPASGSAGTVLTISGTMFSTTDAENTVVVGEASCTVTSSTAEQILCTLQEGAIDSAAAVDVYVQSMGKATSSSTFDYSSGAVSAISPTSGSTAGGTYVSITGNGFTAASTVTVGGSACTVLNRTTALIVCETSAGSGQGDVVVQVPDTLTLSGAYTYSAADTVEVTSFTPANPSSAGGELLALSGAFTGIADMDVELALTKSSGSFKLAINWTATDESVINAPLPALTPGSYTIKLRLGAVGFATFSSIPMLTVELQMNALSIRKGSFEGGTRLVIAGKGFGTDKQLVNVVVGSATCDLEDVTNTQITCYTGKGSRTHVVTNGGTSPDFGLGYQWHPITANIEVNEHVRFVWTSPPFVTTNLFKIVQTVSADGDRMVDGFDSGNGSSTGEFTHQFNTAGTYYYTTGIIGKNEDLEMRGKVVVTEKKTFMANVTVTVGGVMATQSTGSATDGAACAGITSDIPGCSDVDSGSSGSFDFSYMTCLTPTVTNIDVSQGYIDTDITISGTGFSTTACENEVMIGDYKCVPTVSETERIVCNMDASETPAVGISYPITVRVNNRGNALWLAPFSTFALLPSVSSISPSAGSLEGGTIVTITGAGFDGVSEIQLKTVLCSVINNTYTNILCRTMKSYSTFAENVTVVVTSSLGTELPAACTGDCEFTFSSAATPKLTNLTDHHSSGTPVIRDSYTSLTFAGDFLGVNASGLTVKLGESECAITSTNNTWFTCDLGPTPRGSYPFIVDVKGYGYAVPIFVKVEFKPVSVHPKSGSIYGGQLITVSGRGFAVGKTRVDIASTLPCPILDMNITTIICRTTEAPSYGDGRAVKVTVDGSSDFRVIYDHSRHHTPTVASISPTSGGQGDSVTITGTAFSVTPEEISVNIGGAACAVTASTETAITCTLGGRTPGEASIVVNVASYGDSNRDISFTYVLSPGSLSPNQGSFGGGQEVIISGGGFHDGVIVVFCTEMAEVVSVAGDSLTVVTPSYDMLPEADLTCDITVTLEGDSVDLAATYTYARSSTPVINNVTPRRGGTQGGTKITITGANFGTSNNNVSLHGTECTIESQSSTEIVCETNAPGGSYKTNVLVAVGTAGHSMKMNSDFWYVDVWSSPLTWGGGSLPTAGELLVVPKGQLLLLDQDTPVLKMLLIKGGELLFDEKDITLRAENILIVENGKLTVGSEEEPFQHNAVIEMHGQLRAPELPIYGAKALAIREGELNLHGKPLRMTWTRLASTASAGATEINLEWGQSDWPIGGTVAIATTGDRHSQKETELRVITSISPDGKTITLDKALEYTHLGMTEDLGGGHMLEMRAEVGLLTRNVKVVGTRDTQWSDEIKACPDGFDTGEFATQTCFQGRFGNETGSDQFGAHIMFHAPVKNTKAAMGKLSYIEVNYAGQAFRLGRYPIHFHLNGDMSGSYVRGLAIHETFNRAVNIHGTHNVLIEHTVIYNIMGGAFFLEDGIETGNIYRHNLALFVKASSSLLNDDITPAAFWATNPNNTYEHNSVAGGTHFGFWYRLLEHPEGPSATTDICPRKVPLGVSYNNSVHSNGWFGLWTFQDYYPMVGGSCDSTTPEPAVFEKFTVWNCEKGLEYVNGGALQFVDCLLANNKLTGLEGKKNMLLGDKIPYTKRGPLIKDSVIAAYAPTHPHDSGGLRVGIVLPWSAGFMIKNVTFINFDKAEEVVLGMTRIQGTCTEFCGGWNYYMSELKFINGQSHLARFRWQHDGVFVDLDGTFSGLAGGGVVLPHMDTLDPSMCTKMDKFSVGVDGAVCDKSLKFSRFSFNKPNLLSMFFKNVHFTNEFGSHIAVYADKRMTHPKGWTTVLQHDQTYKMAWDGISHITNISYSSIFEDLRGGGIVITHNMSTKPDRVKTSAGLVDIDDASSIFPSYSSSVHGDFYFSDNEKELSYIVSDVDLRAKRFTASYVERKVSFGAEKCYWPECTAPPDQNTLPPITARPDNAVFWSNSTSWPNGILPVDNTDVEIEAGKWVVADVVLPKMKTLLLTGNLELDHNKIPGTDNYRDFVLEVEYLIIMGGRLVVGWEDNRFLGNVEIILHGTENSPNYPQNSGTPIGQKVIGVFGGLDLHGRQRSPVSTTLKSTSAAGSMTITVRDEVDWVVGEEIMVTSTSYDAHQTEIVTITAITDKKVITVSPALSHRHLGEEYKDVRQITHSLRADVSLLSRNIKVRGADHPNLERLGFGGRVLVGAATNDEGNAYIGWARISYTQFIHMGQLGYTEAYDPRYAVSYVQTGSYSIVKPSWMKGNSFYQGLSPQIGLFGCDGIRVSDNIMYQVVGGGMVVYGENHQIDRNIIALNLWTGTYNGRFEKKNVAYEASFELVGAGDITFTGNVAAGSERAGFRVAGEQCGVDAKYTNNRAHSSMFGVMMWEGDEISTECFQVSYYFVWRCTNFGIFIQSPSDRIELYYNVFFENHLGLWTNTYGPPSLSHKRRRKSFHVEGGIISGPTQYYDCIVDVTPNTNNFKLAALAKPWRIGRHGMVGFSLPNADSAPNGLPTHPFRGRMSYPTIDAEGRLQYIVMAHWQKRQCNGEDVMDYVVSSNPSADDLGHPLYTSRMSFTIANMDVDNIVYFHRSNVRKVNPSDCVDMDCDGHKKNMIIDEDSSLAPVRGVVELPQEQVIIDDASYNWDGDARFGLGDYRIPKVMLTYPNSTRRDPPVNKGIHQSDCTYRETWQAYVCLRSKYRLLVIESMDADTEKRRLSPIALRSVTGNERNDYIDLLNGPQDHGWCAGYTCQKRISTFWAVVKMGLSYELYMTGSNPQHTRFYLLQTENHQEYINLAVYYNSPQRLDVFADDVYVYPTNAEIESDGDYKLKESKNTPSEYIPKLKPHGMAGANYFDREWQLQYIHMIHDKVIDIFIKEVVIVSLSLPPMSTDNFFGEAIVENLAAFLGIPANKIRVVNVVRETSKRRRRQSAGPTIKIEIGDPPSAGTNISDVNSGDLSRTVLVNLTRQVVDAVQLGTLGNALNLTVLDVDVQEPLPIPENSTDSDWASLVNASSLAAYIQIPSEMKYAVKIVADKEQQPFPTQPVFEMYDANGALVEVLGSREDPWKIRAVLRAGGENPNVVLIGNTTCGFKKGVCTFVNLGISHSGSGYIIDFEIFDPAEAQYSDVSSSLTLVAAELTAGFSHVPDKDSPLMIGEAFNAVVDIRDLSSLMPLEDIAWAGHTWTALLSIYTPEMSPDAHLNGTLEAMFDPVTGVANFTGISLLAGGRFSLKAMVTSDPAGYSLTGRSSIIEISHNVTMQREQASYNYTVKSSLDYDMHASGKEDIIEATMYNHLKSLDKTAKYHDFTIRRGSIYIDFWATGEDAPLIAIRDAISNAVQDGSLQLALPGTTLTFDSYLYVDGEMHFSTTTTVTSTSANDTSSTTMVSSSDPVDNKKSGANGNATAEDDGDGKKSGASGLLTSGSKNKPGLIAGIICGAALLVAIIGAAIAIKLKRNGANTEPDRVSNASHSNVGTEQRTEIGGTIEIDQPIKIEQMNEEKMNELDQMPQMERSTETQIENSTEIQKEKLAEIRKEISTEIQKKNSTEIQKEKSSKVKKLSKTKFKKNM